MSVGSSAVFNNVPALSLSLARQSSAVSRPRTLARSWGQAASQPKNTSATRQGKVRRESSSETDNTLSLTPSYNTSPSRQSITPQIDEISQTCLFPSPALLTPACSSRATPGNPISPPQLMHAAKRILNRPPATTPRMAPSFATSRPAVTLLRPCRPPSVPMVATRLSSTTCRK